MVRPSTPPAHKSRKQRESASSTQHKKTWSRVLYSLVLKNIYPTVGAQLQDTKAGLQKLFLRDHRQQLWFSSSLPQPISRAASKSRPKTTKKTNYDITIGYHTCTGDDSRPKYCSQKYSIVRKLLIDYYQGQTTARRIGLFHSLTAVGRFRAH